nr:immunoglobulin heavy chain junction region [Mus musculus]
CARHEELGPFAYW